MNNGMKFDPMTGKPLNQENNSSNTADISNQNTTSNQVISEPTVATSNSIQQPNLQGNVQQPAVGVKPQMQQVQPQQDTENININSAANVQQQMQSIPTVDQNRQEFINNTQASNVVKKQEKKSGPNIVFIVILFIIIFAAIFFLFPYLLEHL